MHYLPIFLQLLLVSTPNERDDSLLSFLEQKGQSTTWDALRKMSPHFIDTRLEGGDPRWFEGSFVTSEGKGYEDVYIKFNTLNNALYLRHRTGLYKIPGGEISSFILANNGTAQRFEKGFGMRSEQEIELQASCRLKEALRHLLIAADSAGIEIWAVQTSATEGGGHRLQVTLSTAGTGPIYDLQSELMSSTCLSEVLVKTEVPDVDETRFMEVIAANDGLRLLKLHSSRSTSTESVSLTQHSASHYFTDDRYFLANDDRDVAEVKRYKATIRKALEQLGYEVPDPLPNVGSEKKLVRWLEEAKL